MQTKYVYLMLLRFRSLSGGKTLKTLNKSLLWARTPFKNIVVSNKKCSRGSKLAVFTTFFKVFVRKVRIYLMCLRFRPLLWGKCSNYTARLPFWSTKKHKVATKLISYERYGEILFQKVASGGCLLHFVQDGSSKNAL